MIPEPARLERFFARYEFSVEHNLCASDVDGLAMSDLVDLADAETRRLWTSLTLGYTETPGHPLLREAIAEQYFTLRANDVTVCGGGAAEALYLVSQVLLGPGTHAIVITPAYESLHRVATATGAELSFVALNPLRRWSLDLHEIEQQIRPDTRAIFINFPHNPTGAQLTYDELRAVVSIADRNGVTLVSDEVYRLLEFDPATRVPPAADLSDNAVSISVMSKAYGLAGLRIGWIAARNDDLLARITGVKDYTTVCAAAPSEILSIIALRAADQVIGRCRDLVLENLDHTAQFVDAWRGLIEWTPPGAGTVGYPLLRAGIPIDRFVADLAASESVLLLPGSVFDSTENYFRLGLGRASMPAGLERLDRFMTRTLP